MQKVDDQRVLEMQEDIDNQSTNLLDLINTSEAIVSSKEAVQEVKQEFEDKLQTVDGKINGIKAEILTEVARP